LELRVERLATPDGDAVYLYHRDVGEGRPRLLLLHGLEGSVRSHYVQGFARGAGARGWNFTLIVFRGCGPELNSAPRMYHSGETSDLRLALRTLAERHPSEPIYAAGVSLGGNVLLKYLGEDPAAIPRQVAAAAAVSVPFDLEMGSRHLQRGFARVYDRHFLKSLRRKALQKLAQHPGLFDQAGAASARTIEDFDDAVTGPMHGFAGSNDYYTRSSSINFISRITIPTLLLSARDDPFLPASVLDRVREIADRNPYLGVQFTRRGGHVGFISGSVPFRAFHWGEARVLEFFDEQPGQVPVR
jgi:predicted alpha/beta-fold hydrolase